MIPNSLNSARLNPRYWPLLLAACLLRIIVLLPNRIAFGIGRMLGKVFYLFGKKRRAIALINITICFPQLTEEEKHRLIRQHFESLGMSLISMCMGWWKSDLKIEKLVAMQGGEHLDAALRQNRGVILLSGHFNHLEVSARLFSSQVAHPTYAVYQANSDPMIDEFIQKNRERTITGFISHNDIRKMVYKLKENAVVWYAPDQGYRGKFSEIVPFFGEPSASNTAISRLAKLSKAPVVPFFILQKPDFSGFILKILPPLKEFPTDNPIADTLQYHQILEREIKTAPEQYLWIHRRFKGRPAQYPDVYQDIVLR